MIFAALILERQSLFYLTEENFFTKFNLNLPEAMNEKALFIRLIHFIRVQP